MWGLAIYNGLDVNTYIQGAVWREYIGFVCKEDYMQQRKLFCHMLKADDNKLVGNDIHPFSVITIIDV